MKKILLRRGEFARNTLTLMVGTTIAQAIPIAVSPILTRIYTPEDFGLFALYMSIVTIASIIITGRYELAIVLPEKKEDALNICALSISLTVLFSLITFILVLLFNDYITRILGAPEISKWLYLIPVSLLLTGIYQTLNYWSNRNKRYKRIMLNRIVQASSTATMNIGIGIIARSKGLILSSVIGQGIVCLAMVADIIRKKEMNLKEISYVHMKMQAIRYNRLPKYSVLAHGTESTSTNIPHILLSNFFGAAAVGYFSLARRMIVIPISIISGAVGDVFLQRASREYNLNGRCDKLFIKTLLLLSAIGFPPFLLLFLSAPDLFAFIFGEQWRMAGILTQIMTFPFFLQFVVSPLSHMFTIAEKQSLELILQGVMLIIIVVSIIIGFCLNSLIIAISLFSLAYGMKYIIFLICSYLFSRG